MDCYAKFYGSWVYGREFQVHVRQVEGQETLEFSESSASSPLRVDTFPMEHSPSSLAYRFHVAGKTVVFTGDTGPTPEAFFAFAKHADVLVVECSFPDDRELSGHMTSSQVACLAEAVEPGITVINHVYPFHTPEEAVLAVKQSYNGPVQAAYPGFRLTL